MRLSRRSLLAAPALLLPSRGMASLALLGGLTPPNNAPFQTPAVHISAGQSWRSNSFSSMNTWGIAPQPGGLLAMGLSNSNFPSGVMPESGLNLPATLTQRLVGYTTAMQFSYPGASAQDIGNGTNIGRCAILAQQGLRAANGKATTPIIEYNIAVPSSSWIAGPGGGLGTQTASFTGSCSGTTLTASAVSPGTIVLNQFLIVGGIFTAQITSFISGSGGAGTYGLDRTVSLGSQAMTSQGSAWFNQAIINAALIASLPDNFWRLYPPVYRSVGWTQGGSFDTSSPTPTITEWTAMAAAYDALTLPGNTGSSLYYYIGIRAPNSTDTSCTQAVNGAWTFVRSNANGRTIGTSPWYQWPFLGTDNIHTGDYGTIRHGEVEGMTKYVTEDEGTPYKPLWRSLTLPITRNGQVLTVPFDRPIGSFFASGVMSWMSDANDGIKVWPQNGFHVKRSGVDLTVSPVISGLNVLLTVTETITPGDVLEVSYAYYGPGGTNPGPCSGVGGNLVMTGPASLLFPGKTINAWAWPHLETFTA